jgi:hypothetical protein
VGRVDFRDPAESPGEQVLLVRGETVEQQLADGLGVHRAAPGEHLTARRGEADHHAAPVIRRPGPAQPAVPFQPGGPG